MVKKNKPITIGPQALVNFPKSGIEKVPAKIDTGAEISSIWASSIKERAGKLSYTLFSPESPFYTDKVISTRDYQIRSIRNSFGQSELRYVVKIRTVIEGRDINVSFSLADRSNNNFPILIGRRTLQSRFLVDVSKAGIKKRMDILVLKSKNLRPSGSAAKFFKDVHKKNKNLHFTFVTFNDLEFRIDENDTEIRIKKTKRDIADFDLVYFRVVMTNKDIAAAVAHYLRHNNIPFMDRASLYYHQSINKLHQYIVLQNSGVKVPKSLFLPADELTKSYKKIARHLGLPFILKDIRGKRGRNIYLINNEIDFKKACKKAELKSLELIAQRFIPHESHYRILVLGKHVRLVSKMVHKLSDTRLENHDTEVEPILVGQNTIPGLAREMSIKAADSLLVDVAGVDVIQDKDTGLWYCLEVNESPQLVTGSFMDEKKTVFSEYLTRKMQQYL